VGVEDQKNVYSVCDVSDSCDQLGLPCVRTGAIQPVYPECPPFTGTISTVRLEPGPGMPLDALVDVFRKTTNDAVLIDLGGRTDIQCWGTVLATAASVCGVRAALVNGAVRDALGLAEMKFPTFARGVHPATMRGRLRLVEAEADVVIDGQPVSPGSAVAADANGAIFFPKEHAAKVFGRAKEIAAAERRLLDQIRDARQPMAVLDAMLT
jgi:4-hydroxy-4-methyl-2-oxoglutarate aldolase